MELDPVICSRARRSRDPRFDGRFFVGVITTGIYCRPVCPARAPKEKNVRYYPTAAAAAEAGLRPCLRCRPETAPGTPAWAGTSTTVGRALRLLAECGPEPLRVEALAARLGIGSRHLRRLFLQHLGATPLAVAHTRRIHLAKQLIDGTSLPFGHIAEAAGYGSVRRFNAAFGALYGRTPSALRRLARRAHATPDGEYRFRLGFRAPFDWDGLLGFLGPRAIPGVERVENGVYRRTINVGGELGSLAARLAGNALELRVRTPDPRALVAIVERVRRLFDLDADPHPIRTCFADDPHLGARIAKRPGLRVPGCWDGFELAVRAVLGQQISVKAATTLAGRLARAYGRPVDADGLDRAFPTPASLADADLVRHGLTSARANTVKALARAVASGDVSFADVTDVAAFERQLRGIAGIGPWTTQYIAMRALGEPDAFPVGDLGLLRALGIQNARDLERRAEAWRPWRGYAVMHLWQGG